MTARRIALTYAACAAAGLLIAFVSFRDRPSKVGTMPVGEPVPISLAPRSVPDGR